MAVYYSEDLRIKALGMILEGKKISNVSRDLCIGRTTLYRWILHYKQYGHLKPKQGGHSNKIKDLEEFKIFAESNKGLTSVQMAIKLRNISANRVRVWLHRIGFSRKKRLIHTRNATKRNVAYIWTS